MHPDKVIRKQVTSLTDLPNVGPAVAAALQLLGIQQPEQLKGQRAIALYRRLEQLTGQRQDPCVLDVFLSLVDYADGGAPQVWWAYTAQRKRDHPDL